MTTMNGNDTQNLETEAIFSHATGSSNILAQPATHAIQPPSSQGQTLVRELRDLLYSGRNLIAVELDQKIRDNFQLFDRDMDGYLNEQEVKNLLVSVDVNLEEADIKLLHNELIEDGKGITEENFLLFVLKRAKDEDKETHLLTKFRVVDKGAGHIENSDDFKDLLMSKGLRMTEAEANEMMEILNPKGVDGF